MYYVWYYAKSNFLLLESRSDFVNHCTFETMNWIITRQQSKSVLFAIHVTFLFISKKDAKIWLMKNFKILLHLIKYLVVCNYEMEIACANKIISMHKGLKLPKSAINGSCNLQSWNSYLGFFFFKFMVYLMNSKVEQAR